MGEKMKKKIFVIGILGMFLLASLTVTGVNYTSDTVVNTETNDDVECSLPVMRADSKFLARYNEDYNSEETAFIDPDLVSEIQATEDFSILDLLYYIPEERSQGYCGNCWAWPSTAVLAIALRVQENVMENRLSVQYLNTCGELYSTFPKIECCGGGTIRMLASFYSKTGIAIPWSNDNAHWQDHVLFRQCEIVECDDIAKEPNYPIGSIKSEKITIHNVDEEEAIDNIKNVLHQNRGVYFSVFYADDRDLDHFRDHWSNYDEEDVYDLDWYAGHDWVQDEAVGHAMLVVGYHDDANSDNNDYWIVLNSWGTNDGGRPNGLLRWDMHMDYSLKYTNTYAFGAETLDVTFGSPAPITSITGPTSGRPNKEYTYDVSAVDPQGDKVYLYVNWGDRTNTDWQGPYDSGEVIQFSHKFTEANEYTIKAKAKDISGHEGPEQPLKINLPRNKIVNRPLLNSLRDYITFYQLLLQLLIKQI